MLPLVVDLDGTLIHTDMLHETALRVFRERPWDVLRMPIWLLQGKASLKRRVSLAAGGCDPQALPFNEPFIQWLDGQKQLGRHIVLCTASDQALADGIAAQVGLFDEVMASDGQRNLAGAHKAQALVARFGEKGFDYAGNAAPDLHVWQHARQAILVNASPRLEQQARAVAVVEEVFPPVAPGLITWLRALRVHQWLKNMLLFVPVFAAHQLTSVSTWGTLLLAFVAFSLCASSVYIANDLFDLESDRLHARKRLRPFAAGRLPIWQGVVVAPLLLMVSLLVGQVAGEAFLRWLLFYFVVTCVYSWGLKRLMLVDCLTLAWLYTLRILAGAAAAGLALSFWLLAFSVFLFLSLAFVKRYAELTLQLLSGKEKVHGRGYYTSDATIIQSLGVAAGYASVVVLALYFNSDAVMKLYRMPEYIWGAVPVMLFWVSWMWVQAHRGRMHDDPLVFAVKDKASLAAGLVFAAVLAVGAKGLVW